ncbi:MAG: CcmD family protein [Ferruginibacter sp.]
MNKLFSRFSLLLCALLAGSNLIAQDKVEMADVMRSNGKIYVVVAVCLIILIGLFFYVMMLDRKISKIEKESR